MCVTDEGEHESKVQPFHFTEPLPFFAMFRVFLAPFASDRHENFRLVEDEGGDTQSKHDETTQKSGKLEREDGRTSMCLYVIFHV